MEKPFFARLAKCGIRHLEIDESYNYEPITTDALLAFCFADPSEHGRYITANSNYAHNAEYDLPQMIMNVSEHSVHTHT